MKKTNGIGEFFKKRLEYCVALFALVLFTLISVSDSGRRIEFSLYNTLLTIKPAPVERKDVLLVNIDDSAIEDIGAWPWSRDVLADLLIRLREAGGKYAVFDIEYLNPGQTGVNRSYVKNELPAQFAGTKNGILGYVNDFSQAVATQSIPLSYVPDVSKEMSGYINQDMDSLSGSITGNIFRDNDEYFASAIHFFGNAFLTINSEKINTLGDAKPAEDYAHAHLMFTNVVDADGLIPKENALTRNEKETRAEKGIAPAILPLISKARGAGFPNVVIDKDGVRRRIPLLVEHEGAYVGQLVFTPILNMLQPEKIVRTGNRLVLEKALDPDNPASGKRADITIPLDEDGRILVNWVKKKFTVPEHPELSSFRNISVSAFKHADELEEKVIDNLASIEALNIKTAKGYLSYHDAVVWLRAARKDLDGWKADLLSGKKDDFDAYFAAKKEFFSNYGQFLDGGYDTEIYDTIDRVSAASGDTKYAKIKKDIQNNFRIYRDEYKAYIEQEASLEKVCALSFCVIGYTGVGTSDLGVNPFQKEYPNVGTHANIYNTIMTRQFIMPLPMWVSWLVALGVCYLVALGNRRIKSLQGRVAFGVASSVFTFLLFAALFSFARIYIELFVPLLSVILTFILVSILRFMFSEQEKSFLRKAFTTYLSPDVVDQIVDNPGLLKLGGQEKQITALFTDIKSFSTLSEKVTPEHLVQILNRYLTVMSDIVLEEKGTIDKYIGDAIVSFFGAPIDLPDHAKRACLAAIRMKEAEDRLNEEFKEAGDVPMEIHTRIGVNTGAMVVGNMGTDNKMNYTIMGNDVNLAARLEGVNKQYGTWILVSESTWNATEGMFVGRKLDRVRVVGINTPVQLWNLVAVRSEATPQLIALTDRFNLAIDAYREKRLDDAIMLFTKCLESHPDDAASSIFLERVRELKKSGLPAEWSDIINMTSK
jgi:adenylate cyclase